MYHYNYIQDQWLILSLGGGTLLVLVIVLSYIAMWRPRPPGTEEGQPRKASTDTLRFIPLVLVVIYLVIFVYYFISPFLLLYPYFLNRWYGKTSDQEIQSAIYYV